MIRISVCIPLYNGLPYIKEQLESILEQLTATDEVVISDDGSTDGSVAWIKSLKDPRIHVLTGLPARNPSYNLEKALLAARGEYIFLADQDDIWLPGKVAQMLAVLQHHTLVVHDCSVTDESLQTMIPSFISVHGSGPGFWKNLTRNSFLGCCMGFRRTLLNKALPFPRPLPMHDSWLGLVATAWYEVAFLPVPLLLYRRHGANASSTSAPSAHGLFTKIQHRWWLIKGLIETLWRKK